MKLTTFAGARDLSGSRLRIDGDRGSVMMLVVGMVPILFLIVAVGVDVSVLFIHQRSLSTAADAAALAGAQSADLNRVYARRANADLPLDCAAARRAVNTSVSPTRVDSRSSSATVESVRCDGTEVTVNLRAIAQLPFSQHFGITPRVRVRGHATARSPLR